MILLELFWEFFKIGAFTFGGGYAMMPMIEDAVHAKAWITDAELINFIAVSESTPGPFAINMATYIGTSQAGWLGAIAATLGVVLPSFIIILIVARCYEAFKKNRIVKGCMSGLKPAVIGLIGATVISIGMTVFFAGGFDPAVFTSTAFYGSLVIFALGTVLAFKKVHPILIICLAAVLGIVAGYALNLPIAG